MRFVIIDNSKKMSDAALNFAKLIARVERRAVQMLLSFPAELEDVNVELPPRLFWLRPQKQIYEFMHVDCSLCMRGIHFTDTAKQHDDRHPPVCKACMSRVNECPFCRKLIKPFRIRIRAPPQLDPYPLNFSNWDFLGGN